VGGLFSPKGGGDAEGAGLGLGALGPPVTLTAVEQTADRSPELTEKVAV
jgi:hypothetical protein